MAIVHNYIAKNLRLVSCDRLQCSLLLGILTFRLRTFHSQATGSLELQEDEHD